MRTIAVDFDGVIHRYSKRYHDGTIYDPPIAGAKEALADLVSQGHRVVILTSRLAEHSGERSGDVVLQRTHMEAWLAENGFETGVHYHEMTGVKIPAAVYIDDRGITFESWEQALTDVARRLN